MDDTLDASAVPQQDLDPNTPRADAQDDRVDGHREAIAAARDVDPAHRHPRRQLPEGHGLPAVALFGVMGALVIVSPTLLSSALRATSSPAVATTA
jgi:hypothetical protein